MTPGPRPILWDIYEEHLDEAAFLWGQWERGLVAANYVLRELVEGPEERLLAHLDGLVLGGRRVAEKLLLPALEDDDTGKVFAAAWALVQAEDADHLDAVFAALPKAKPPARAALGRAFELSSGGDLAKRLATVWEKSEAPVRGALFDALAALDAKWAGEHVPGCLAESDPTLRCAALRALRGAPDRALGDPVEQALVAEDAAVRQEAIASGFVLRLPSVHEACKREAQRTDDGCRLPLALLAMGGTPDGRLYLTARLAAPDVRRHVLWALGFAGDVAAAEAAIAVLDDEKIARVAGEALTAITGVAIAGPLVKPGVTKGPGVEDVAPDDPPPEALPEDLLLVPAPEAVRKWWAGARGRLQAGTRYLYGQARQPDGVRSALRVAAMWRHPVLGMEVARATGGGVDSRGWARKRK